MNKGDPDEDEGVESKGMVDDEANDQPLDFSFYTCQQVDVPKLIAADECGWVDRHLKVILRH